MSMRKRILGYLLLTMLIVSCTNQETIDIAYQNNVSISAHRIFDSFTPVMESDFTLKDFNNSNWLLNMHAFVYNQEGKLVKKEEGQYAELTSKLEFELNLLPGKYSIVAIADFSTTYEGKDWKYWNVLNEETLKDLIITENEVVFTTPFETLGIISKEFEVGNRVENFSLDIKPVTGLMQTVFCDDDIYARGENGFSFLAPYIKNISFFTTGLKQVVKFNGNLNPEYDYSETMKANSIQWHSPSALYYENNSTRAYTYRAFLPQEGLKFYWELNCLPGVGKYLFTDGQDFQRSEWTDNQINIQSGGQYDMDFILDMLYLYVQNHQNVNMDDRVNDIQKIVNMKYINELLDRKYDSLVGESRTTIESYLQKENFGESELRALYYFGENLLDYMAVDFSDATMSKSIIVRLCFYEELNSAASEAILEALTTMYIPYETEFIKDYYQFLNAPTLDDATIKIVWDNRNKWLYFEAI